MSSNYHVLCVSHDPAIVITEDHEFRSPHDALAAAANPASHERLAGHVGCDLLVGRYSYPLIEVGCPGGDRCRPGYHRPDSDMWADAGWLRLLHAAHSRGDDVTGFRLRPCWTRSRVLSLARELHIETPEPATTGAAA